MLKIDHGRRRLLGGALSLGAAMTLGQPAFAMDRGERRLAFRNVHTNERVDARYFSAGGFDRQGLAEINHGLRDWRNGESRIMDHDLLDLLTEVRGQLGVAPSKGFDLISGYRSPATNAALRERGGSHTGVASHSQHILGKATDIAMPGISLDRIRRAALSVGRGGVGYYPHDGFVHVDTGDVRTW